MKHFLVLHLLDNLPWRGDGVPRSECASFGGSRLCRDGGIVFAIFTIAVALVYTPRQAEPVAPLVYWICY